MCQTPSWNPDQQPSLGGILASTCSEDYVAGKVICPYDLPE